MELRNAPSKDFSSFCGRHHGDRFCGAPTVSFGIECLQLCKHFQPQHGATHSSGYGCQDLINDSGGFCTLDGKLNMALDLPKPRILYNKRSASGKQQIYVDSLRATIER